MFRRREQGAQLRRPEEVTWGKRLSQGRTNEEGHMRVSQIFSTGGGCGHGGGDGHHGKHHEYESGWYGGYGHHHDYYESDYHYGGRGRDHEEFLEVAGIGIL